MTTKEKAKHLVWDFYNIQSNEYDYGMNWEMAKQCALIAVYEILNDYSYMQNVRNANSNQIHSQRGCWQEVKQEIELL